MRPARDDEVRFARSLPARSGGFGPQPHGGPAVAARSLRWLLLPAALAAAALLAWAAAEPPAPPGEGGCHGKEKKQAKW